jgi:simple sugar transport system substrate-binding protein
VRFDVHSIKTRLTAIGLAVPLVLGMAGSAMAQEDGGSNPASCNYPGDLTGGKSLVIVIEGLGDPSSGFFRTLNNGAQQAGEDLCVEVRYIYPQGGSFDLASYTQQIEQSIAAQPDGIVILGIGPLDDVAQRAVDAGIAVGFQPAPSVKDQALRAPDDIYVSRVGADEYAGGAMAANRFIADGASSLVCVQQDPADGTQSMRCQGMADVAAEAGVGYELVAGSPDPGQTASILEPFLRANPDVDALLATGGSSAPGLVTAKNAVGRELFTAGFDVLPNLVQLIQDGELTFTIDQQGYWRGYVSVMQLVHYLRYGLVQANYYLTGPIMVDASNADAVATLAEAGVR